MSIIPVDSHSLPYVPPAHEVAESTFVGLLWGGVVLALLFFAFRVYVRINSFHRLFWDDFLVMIAWLMLLANAIISQYAKTALYLVMSQKNTWNSSDYVFKDFGRQTDDYNHKSIAILILFYSSLWCVKLSFLVFFRRLGRKVPRQKVIWWSVLVAVIAPFFVLLGVWQWHCYITHDGFLAYDCQTPKSVAYQRATYQASCAVDIITDAMIIFVPLNVLWRVQINLSRKLALAGIFSLSVFVMIIAIFRVTFAYRHGQQADLSWLGMWAALEQTVAIIVACLASFRVLFTQQGRYQGVPDVKNVSGPTPLHGNKTESSMVRRLKNTTSAIIKSENKSSWDVDDNTSSIENRTPPSEGICVRRDFDVAYNVERPHEVV